MRFAPLFRLFALSGAVSTLLLVGGCQSERPAAPTYNSAALPTMERIALGANSCWFKSGDAAFKPYKLAPELNSFSGRPRILIVKRNSPESRPLAVVQAEGHPSRIEAFGPLLNETVGTRMKSDIRHWAQGGAGCPS